MRRLLIISLFAFLGVARSMAFGWHEVNIDATTISAMGAAYQTETEVERQITASTDSIFRKYLKTSVATAGIFEAKRMEHNARKDVKLFSSEEFFYYKKAVQLVRDDIMPTLIRVTYAFLSEPDQILQWGAYLYTTTEEVKSLCQTFESVVTNGKLSFKDLVFYEINKQFMKYFDLLQLAQNVMSIDYKALFDKLGDFGKGLTWSQIKDDIEHFVQNLAGVGKVTGDAIWTDATQIGKVFKSSPVEIIEMFNNYKRMYHQFRDASSAKQLLLQVVDTHNPDWMAQIFDVSDYNINNYMSSYIQELQGTYYTQTWYIKRKSSGSKVLVNYIPPKGEPNPDPYHQGVMENAIFIQTSGFGKGDLNPWNQVKGWDAWKQNVSSVIKGGRTTDANSVSRDNQHLKLTNQELAEHALSMTGWSYDKIKQYKDSHPGHNVDYSFSYYHYDFVAHHKQLNHHKDFCFQAYGLKITDTWSEDSTVYEETFDSQTMDLETFKKKMQVRLKEYEANMIDSGAPEHMDYINDNLQYVIEPGPERHYTLANQSKLKGIYSVTYIAQCENSLKLGEGTFSWKVNSKKQKGSLTEYSKELAMETRGESIQNEMDQLVELEKSYNDSLTYFQQQEEANDKRLTEYRNKANQARLNGNTAQYQYYQNLWEELNEQQDFVKSEEQRMSAQLNDLSKAKEEYWDDLIDDADNDIKRIPWQMNVLSGYYAIRWADQGKWEGYTYTCEGYSETGRFPVKFTAKLSLARKPTYFMGIRIHRPILQVEYTLTSDNPSTSVLETMNLDPKADAKSNEEKVNKRLKELMKDFPDCEIKIDYMKSNDVEDDDDEEEDKINLLFASERLEVAREVVDRLIHISSDLHLKEMQLHYRKTLKQFLTDLVLDLKDQGRRQELTDRIFLEWKQASRVASLKQSPLYRDSTKVESPNADGSGGSEKKT